MDARPPPRPAPFRNGGSVDDSEEAEEGAEVEEYPEEENSKEGPSPERYSKVSSNGVLTLPIGEGADTPGQVNGAGKTVAGGAGAGVEAAGAGGGGGEGAAAAATAVAAAAAAAAMEEGAFAAVETEAAEGRAEEETEAARRHEELEAAQRAVSFSRALYALEPLDGFPDDPAEEEEDEAVAAEAGGGLPGLRSRGAEDASGGRGGGGGGGDAGGNRHTRRLKKKRGARKGLAGGGGFGGDHGRGVRRGQQARVAAPPPLTRLDVVEAELQSELLSKPFGEAVLEALQRTVDQEEAVPGGGGGRVWSRSGAWRAGEEDGREGERVEAGARRTALWGVALGKRMELPDGVRVRGEKGRGRG